MVLEKTLESPLDCKEIQPVHPKGDHCWVFIGRIDAEAENSNTLATSCEELDTTERLNWIIMFATISELPIMLYMEALE